MTVHWPSDGMAGMAGRGAPPYAARRRRMAELAALRIERRLTDAELVEEDRLTSQLYMHTWRETQRAKERAIQSASPPAVATPSTPRADGEPRPSPPMPPAAAGAHASSSAAVGKTRAVITAILAKRAEHHARGYTPAHDAALPRAYLANESRRYIAEGLDLIQRGRPDAQVRVKLLNAAALLVAALERLEPVPGETEKL